MSTVRNPTTTPLGPVTLPGAQPAAGWQAWLDPRGNRYTAFFLLVLLCGALCCYGLDIGELYRTEALRAIIAAEMLQSGDWIVPRLYGEPLLTKPPGMYAAIAAASLLNGQVTEWTARLPSALASTALIFLLYWYVSRQVGRLGGLIAAAVTPCTILWLDKAAAAEIDMLQVFWVAAALLFFFRAVEAEEDKGTRGQGDKGTEAGFPLSPCPHVSLSFLWWLLALLCVAGGVLTKWTAPVFFYGAAIPFLIWRRRFLLLFSWQHLLAAALGAALCFGWVGLVLQQAGWETFYATVRNEALPRLSHQHHLGSAGDQLLETLAHPFRLLLVNLPWSGFALATLLPGFMKHWEERGRRLVQAFHCWTWPNLLIWTILPDHATRHSFPLFTGITCLAALAWLAYLDGRLSEWQSRWFGRYAVLSLVVFGVGALAGGVAGFRALPSAAWWLVLLIVGMALWCVVEGLRAFRDGRLSLVLTSIIVAWVVLKVAFVHVYVPIRNHGRQPREKAAILAEHVPEGQTLYVFLLKDEGIMFYYGRPVVRLKSPKQLPKKTDRVYCILQESEYEEFQKHAGWNVILEVPLKDEQGDPIVLLGLHRVRVLNAVASMPDGAIWGHRLQGARLADTTEQELNLPAEPD
jgi:4-amino-4-deoxy-L-arabinose transferase-like glycosyltransferase